MSGTDLSPSHRGHALLDATAGTLRLALEELREMPVILGEEDAWADANDRLDDAIECCRLRLPLGGADYIDDFATDLREMIPLVGKSSGRLIFAALAMLPALRRSMSDTNDTTTKLTIQRTMS